jgi:acyl-CoA thioester hydrolase
MRFELPIEKKFVHQMVVPLRWGDMDAMGHINNTLYFRYMEIARLEWIFEVSGRSQLAGEGPVIINTFCNFLRQLEFPGDLRVKTFVANPGRTSFESYHTMERSDEPGTIYAEGGARIVWSDYAARKSAPLPDWFRALLV